MTIIEALKRSKETGESFMRESPGLGGWHGWIAYSYPATRYELSFEDLVAEDWITTADKMQMLSGGRYELLGRVTPAGPMFEAAGKGQGGGT